MRATSIVLIVGIFMLTLPVAADDRPLSEATEACLMCHEPLHPGIMSIAVVTRGASRTWPRCTPTRSPEDRSSRT